MVFDTNILISGVLYIGKPKKLIDLVLQGKIELISSLEIIEEFREVIARVKFKLSKEEQEIFTSFIIRISTIIDIKNELKIVEKDPDDDKIIATAYEGKASYIVSGDRHLLDIGGFAGIRILTANDAVELLNNQN